MLQKKQLLSYGNNRGSYHNMVQSVAQFGPTISVRWKCKGQCGLERGTGLEPVSLAWEARAQPIYQPRERVECNTVVKLPAIRYEALSASTRLMPFWGKNKLNAVPRPKRLRTRICAL